MFLLLTRFVESLSIPAEVSGEARAVRRSAIQTNGTLAALLLVLLFMTDLRQLVVWVSPLLALIHWWFSGRPAYDKRLWLLAGLTTLPILSGWLFDGGHLFHNLISFWVLLSVLLFMLIPMSADPSKDNLSRFMFKCFVCGLLACDVAGIVQYIMFYEGRLVQHDDNFIGFYGRSGIAMHGLAILNYGFSLVFASWYISMNRLQWLLLSLFFLASATLCFYGLGSLFWMLAMGLLVLTRWKNKRSWAVFLTLFMAKSLLSLVLAPTTLAYTMSSSQKVLGSVKGKQSAAPYLSHDTAGANSQIRCENIIMTQRQRICSQQPEVLDTAAINTMIDLLAPRKVQAMQAWFGFMKSDLVTALGGLGPGTVNSRVSFFLTGSYSGNKTVNALVPVRQPLFAAAYIHPLWSPEVLAIRYSDGTRNQPFSSLLALFAEYGLVFGLTTLLVVGLFWWRIVRNLIQTDPGSAALTFSLWLMLLGHLATDNFAESSEFILLVLLVRYLPVLSSPTFNPSTSHADPDRS